VHVKYKALLTAAILKKGITAAAILSITQYIDINTPNKFQQWQRTKVYA
jgi:hypothetical protein